TIDRNEQFETGIAENKFDNFNIAPVPINESRLTVAENQALIKEIESHYDYYLQSEWAVERKTFIDNFQILELNGDNKPDILYQGWSGGEPDCVKIHFSNKDGFDAPVSFYQYLKDIKVEKGEIKSLTTVDPGCCAEYVEQELTYSF